TLPTAGPTAATILRGTIRTLGLLAFAVVFYAAVGGVDDAGFNIAPYALYVGFWVGLIVFCALVGDVFSVANPFDTIALILRIPERTSRSETRNPGQWTAAG